VQVCAEGLQSSTARARRCSHPSLLAVVVVVDSIGSSSSTRCACWAARCAGGPQTSTLWYTRSDDEGAERWFALGVAEPRRDEPDVVLRGRKRGTPPRRCSRHATNWRPDRPAPREVSGETRLRGPASAAAGRSGDRTGLPQGARPESCRTRDLPMDLTLAVARLNCCAIHKLHRPNPRANSPLEIYNCLFGERKGEPSFVVLFAGMSSTVRSQALFRALAPW